MTCASRRGTCPGPVLQTFSLFKVGVNKTSRGSHFDPVLQLTQQRNFLFRVCEELHPQGLSTRSHTCPDQASMSRCNTRKLSVAFPAGQSVCVGLSLTLACRWPPPGGPGSACGEHREKGLGGKRSQSGLKLVSARRPLSHLTKERLEASER